MSDKDLAKLLKPGLEREWDKIARSLFEDPNSLQHQSGLFKCEGFFKLAMFRSCKCYVLENEEGREVRARSVPRRQQKKLPDSLFGQDPLTNSAVVRTTCMRASAGIEIYMMHESRTLCHTLNFKRKQIVSQLTSFWQHLAKTLLCFFSSLQDCVHSVALD